MDDKLISSSSIIKKLQRHKKVSLYKRQEKDGVHYYNSQFTLRCQKGVQRSYDSCMANSTFFNGVKRKYYYLGIKNRNCNVIKLGPQKYILTLYSWDVDYRMFSYTIDANNMVIELDDDDEITELYNSKNNYESDHIFNLHMQYALSDIINTENLLKIRAVMGKKPHGIYNLNINDEQ